MSAPSFDTLKPILEKYGHWRGDPLSLDLERWGKKVNALNLDRCLLKLISKILINPLDSSLRLKKPMLDREWVWEEYFLKDYQAKAETPTLSLFDHKLMNVEPHLFAQELLEWANPEGAAETREVAKTASKVLVVDRETARKTQVVYTILAKRFVEVQLWRDLTRSLKESTRVFELSAMASESQALVLREQNEREVARFSGSLTADKDSVKEIQNASVAVRQSIVSDREKDLLQTQKDLERMKTTSTAQLKQMESLREERARMG